MSFNLITTLTLYQNPHYLSRYIKFIESRPTRVKDGINHLHHKLPKAKDFFPQFRRISDHKWNGIYLTPREHFIAHYLLHKSFPGSSQSVAFFNMSNICGRRSSKAYQEALNYQKASILEMTKRPDRNSKISAALSGKPKSAEHRAKMIGHSVSQATREKLKKANLGKKASEESRKKMSLARIGKKRGAHSNQAKANISNSRKGARWYQNGIISRQFKENPGDGWSPGRLMPNKK